MLQMNSIRLELMSNVSTLVQSITILDIYQINSTYYSALGDDDVKYFLARLIQAFAPGIPQLYYVGLLAGKNDLKLIRRN